MKGKHELQDLIEIETLEYTARIHQSKSTENWINDIPRHYRADKANFTEKQSGPTVMRNDNLSEEEYSS
jgi:hypothetical protein